METSLPLASDSFSYSWLSNSNKSHVSYLDDEPHRDSFNSFYGDSTSNNTQNFNFDSISQSNAVLVHADEIFSDGFLKPFYNDSSKVELFCNTSEPIQTMFDATFSSRTFSSRNMEIRHGFLTRLRKSTWRTLVQFFRSLNTLRHKMERPSRKMSRDNDIYKTNRLVKSLSRGSQKSSPIGNFHLDHDDQIFEAVLHCKRSIGRRCSYASVENKVDKKGTRDK
ncbi:membrane-associated kinase regulator-like protein, putative [Medicago truncatula]|uniref:Membrane-associated kinase regulator-like protein, putative n=1 Tax=Medicago truncatula TaxID=3880 RepID=G7KDT9_MEDTR|nr:membrane-associated kinase regulator-like protein, putative [Medicago truncatula]